jgi:FtsP/CotA-like multicopper oxidase with cupredoxin domain
MYIDEKESRRRQMEAQNARNNRAEIIQALSQGQITKRDLVRWGIFTAGGMLACKNGLSPFAQSAFALVPTGTPRSPLFGATKFSQPLQRLDVQQPIPLTRNAQGHAAFPSTMPEPLAKKLSYHTDYNAYAGSSSGSGSGSNPFRNPLTNRGPMEGRPPGEFFAHQRWDEFFPKVGYVLSMGQCNDDTYFHPRMPHQDANSMWSFGAGRFARGKAVPPLIKGRYGEPILARIYNNLPVDRSKNNGFGRNEISTHFHNAHNGAESDGANNAFHFPGTFYDYRWSTTLARRDKINTLATDRRASGPDGNGGLKLVAGDFRELQGSMWFHDHRFFFTAENVYKGNVGAINYYSGPDRGHEELEDGVNLRLPSGKLLDYGNVDFDVNLIVTDCAYKPDGQLFFDIFDSDGFVGDVMCVNNTFAPFFEVLPRKYRFRLLNACMSRFIKLVLADATGKAVPFQFIANDGNLVVNPLTLQELDEQGTGERYDIVIDFSKFKIGSKVRLLNLLKQTNGRKPDKKLSIAEATKGVTEDPGAGPLMEFRVVGQVQSVDVPGVTLRYTDPDRSRVPSQLTEQIPIVVPVRSRVVEFKRKEPNPSSDNGGCIPSCEDKEFLPWVVSVNGEKAHSLNANRISMLIPKPGEVEHWTYINGGGGWDHPIHLHFEEGITINRGTDSIPSTERLVRKDVWRLRPGGQVKFQVQFGEFGGSYVNHCHNTVHEDFAMLQRYQVLSDNGEPQLAVSPTPIPTEDGVTFMTPEILPEGDPRKKQVSSK